MFLPSFLSPGLKAVVRQASLISIQPYYKVLKAKLTGSRTAQMCVKNDQIFAFYTKLYIPSTLNTDYLTVCSKILNHGLNHGLLFSLFKFFG